MSRLCPEEIYHTDNSMSIQEILVGEATKDSKQQGKRIRKISDLFPDLEFETERDIYHLSASVIDDIVNKKVFGSHSSKEQFINDWYTKLNGTSLKDRLSSLSLGLQVYSQNSVPRDNCIKWLLSQVADCAQEVQMSNYSRLNSNSFARRFSEHIQSYIRENSEFSDLKVVEELVEDLISHL